MVKKTIDHLYISSWDQDYCSAAELEAILKDLKPSQILYPGYLPNREKANQVDSMSLIDKYLGPPTPKKYKGNYIGWQAQSWGYSNFTYSHGLKFDNPNDNSVIHMWRTGNFNVLSLGDLESSELVSKLTDNDFLKEVDVLILPHHGSSKEFTTKELLEALAPRLCLALVDRNNQYGHPDPTVEQRAREHSRYISTKDGDIIIETTGSYNTNFKVYNYISSGNKLESIEGFESKKYVKYYHS